MTKYSNLEVSEKFSDSSVHQIRDVYIHVNADLVQERRKARSMLDPLDVCR